MMISAKFLPTQIQTREHVYLDQQDTIYYLVEGRASLYISEVDQGQLIGKRKFLFSVDKGGIFFPFPFPNGKLAFVADLLPNSVIVKWSWDEFLQLIEHQAEIMEAFENWLSHLSECMSFKTLPRKMTVLENEADYYIIEEELIYAPKGLLWISPFVKSVFYWNHFELQPKQFAPLSMTGWVWAEAGNKLTVIPTKEFVYLPEFKKSVDLFLTFIAQSFIKKQELLRFHEQKRIIALKEVEEGKGKSLEEISPLFLCCQWLCEAAGINQKVFTSKLKFAHMQSVEEIFQEVGIRYQQVILQGQWWKENHGPLLGFWRDHNPVVLIPFRENQYCYKDVGGSGFINKSNVRLLKPVAFKVYRTFPIRFFHIKQLLSSLF